MFAQFQLRAAALAINTMAEWAEKPPTTNPAAFAGVTAYGFPLPEPLISVIDRYIPAPVEPLPAPWWDDSAQFDLQVQKLIASEIQDAARSAAQVELKAAVDADRYVRLLTPPSCDRCVALAGRIYRDSEAFERHPGGCDCVHVPVASLDEALRSGLVQDGRELVERGQVRGLSEADRRAILDGADLGQVINAKRGTSTPGITDALEVDLFGRRVKSTTYGTTKRSAWRKANPSRLVRLRPEAIYGIAGDDRDEALRLLRLYGYLVG